MLTHMERPSGLGCLFPQSGGCPFSFPDGLRSPGRQRPSLRCPLWYGRYLHPSAQESQSCIHRQWEAEGRTLGVWRFLGEGKGGLWEEGPEARWLKLGESSPTLAKMTSAQVEARSPGSFAYHLHVPAIIFRTSFLFSRHPEEWVGSGGDWTGPRTRTLGRHRDPSSPSWELSWH